MTTNSYAAHIYVLLNYASNLSDMHVCIRRLCTGLSALPGRFAFRMDPAADVIIPPHVKCSNWYLEERYYLESDLAFVWSYSKNNWLFHVAWQIM